MRLDTTTPEAAEILLMGLLTILRRTRTPKWCAKNLVGPLRAMIGDTEDRAHVQSLTPGLDASRAKAATLLHRHCQSCRACKLGRR